MAARDHQDQNHLKTIAIFFGGRSVEHDVSVLTALQAIAALNPLKYKPFPVYVDPLGQFWGGAPLFDRANYPIDPLKLPLLRLSLDIASAQGGQPAFTSEKKKLFGVEQVRHPFDLALPAIHGSNGEDGSLQGLFDFAAIPYTGCRPLAASATMDKGFTKRVLRSAGVKVLEDCIIRRPAKGQFLSDEELTERVKQFEVVLGRAAYPLIVKPCNLGSSVGVSKADSYDDLMAGLLTVFRMDHAAIVEPFVPNLCEYNVAVRRLADGSVSTSAIEEPIRDTDLLDFQTKYRRGGKGGKMGDKLGGKVGGSDSEGMASLGRKLNPESLSEAQQEQIRSAATTAFDQLDLAGSVRIDFLCDSASGDIWLNEINTVPGSFAFYLWEGASPAVSFLDLVDGMIEEGAALSKARGGNTSAAYGKASLLGS